MKISIGFLPTG